MSSGSGGRYVPPHLRGRGNSSGSKPSGSRWKNIHDGTNGGNSRNGNHHNARYGGRNSNNNNNNHRTGTDSGVSRWANVDRSAIAAGNHRSNRNNTSNNQNRLSPHYHQHRRRFDRTDEISHAKAVFFGDSSIKLFGLLNDYCDSIPSAPRPIEVHKYKAASAKGLTRGGNENREAILRTVAAIRRRGDPSSRGNGNRAPSRPSQNPERLVFCFGSVDVHLSYYYKKYVQEQPLSDDDLRAIATGYVDFVAGLETAPAGEGRPLDKLVVGIYPSPLRDEDVGASLLAYGSLETDEQVRAVDAAEDRTIESRQARVDLFNRALRDRCAHHNREAPTQHHGRLEYWDVRDELLARGDDGRLRVRDAYKDVSDLNIHLIHETTLQLWVQKWPWYEALTTTSSSSSSTNNDSGGATGFLEYLQTTFDEYRKTKPWAERTHVAETRGIRLSL